MKKRNVDQLSAQGYYVVVVDGDINSDFCDLFENLQEAKERAEEFLEADSDFYEVEIFKLVRVSTGSSKPGVLWQDNK